MKEQQYITPWAYDTEIPQITQIDIQQSAQHNNHSPEFTSNYNSLSSSTFVQERDPSWRNQRFRLVKTASAPFHKRALTVRKFVDGKKTKESNLVTQCLKSQKDKLQRYEYQSLSTKIITPQTSISHKNLQFNKIRQKQIKNSNTKVIKPLSSAQKNQNKRGNMYKAAKLKFFDSQQVFLNQKMQNILNFYQQKSTKGLQIRISGLTCNFQRNPQRTRYSLINNGFLKW